MLRIYQGKGREGSKGMDSEGRETEIKQRRIGNKWEGGQKEWEVREENGYKRRIRDYSGKEKGKHKTNKDESSMERF